MKLNKKTAHISQLAEVTPNGLALYTYGDQGECVIGLELRKDKKLHATEAFDCYYDSERNENVEEEFNMKEAVCRWAQEATRLGASLIIDGELVPTAFIGNTPYEVAV